jgi:GNAT superfamily N-acetyltransferase
VIRAATVADAADLSAIQARGWRWAYGDFVDEERMPVAAERVDRWREIAATGRVRVFDQDGAVVGFAGIDGEQLTGLYVDPPAQGAGVGGRLLTDAEERLRAGGHARAWLWVFEANAHGRAFYERRGWVRDGEPVMHEGWSAPALRYEREL